MTEEQPVQVVLDGIRTPLHLSHLGPVLPESDVAAFEASLGWPLPTDYREFLLRYNGGMPLVTAVENGEYEDNLSLFYGLIPEAQRSSWEAWRPLKARQSEVWGLPNDVLAVAGDAGGNLYVLSLREAHHPVRFVNHERLDEPFQSQRTVAHGFTSLLRQFRSLETQAELDAEDEEEADEE